MVVVGAALIMTGCSPAGPSANDLAKQACAQTRAVLAGLSEQSISGEDARAQLAQAKDAATRASRLDPRWIDLPPSIDGVERLVGTRSPHDLDPWVLVSLPACQPFAPPS